MFQLPEEVDVVHQLKAVEDSDVGTEENPNKMKKIVVTAKRMQKKPWFGFSAEEIAAKYDELYKMGQILSCNYFVNFEPYDNNATRNLALFDDDLSGFLVTETNLPLIDAQFEEVKTGSFTTKHLNGISSVDLQMNFHETSDGRIARSFLDWCGLMVNKDGTQNCPADYQMRIKVGYFGRVYGLDDQPFERSFLVAPSQAMIDGLAAASVSETLVVPGGFTVMRSYME